MGQLARCARPRDQVGARRAALGAVVMSAAAGLLVACATNGSGPGGSTTAAPGSSPFPSLPSFGGSKDDTAKAPSASPPTPDPDIKKPVAKEFKVSPDEVKSMLIRSDPKACSATSDASFAEMAVIYARISVQLGTGLLITSATDNNKLQANLDAFRPHLRELSRNTNWLPQSAERLIGERLYAMNELKPFVPPARQKPLLDNTILPIYKQLVSFAKVDLKSPVDFDLRVVRDDKSTSPMAIAGGIILVPSGMFSAMQRVKDPEHAIAFMLAHEFSHVLRRHKTKMVQLSLVDSITIAAEYKQLYNSGASGLSTASDPGKLLQFSTENVKSLMDQTCKTRNWLPNMEQNQEFEADVCGSLLLKKLSATRKPPFDAVKGYGNYLSYNLATPVPVAQEGQCVVQASHPAPERRMENLKSYATALDGKP